MNNQERYDQFASYLKLEHGLQDSTITRYIENLDRFKRFIESETDTLPKKWHEITDQDIRKYITKLKPSPSYANLIVATLRRFFKFQIDVLEERTIDPTSKLARPKQSKHHPPAIETDKVKLAMDYAYENSREDLKIRNWSFIALLYGTGLRISEACGLRMANIRYQDELPYSVTVIGKGNKERTVVMNATAQAGLYKWLRYRQKLLLELPPTIDRQIVWLIPSGRYAGEQVKPPTIRHMLRDIGDNCLGERLHPHMFRHTFVTEAVRAGSPIHAVQASAGHADLSTTGNYMHANESDVAGVASAVPDVLNQ